MFLGGEDQIVSNCRLVTEQSWLQGQSRSNPERRIILPVVFCSYFSHCHLPDGHWKTRSTSHVDLGACSRYSMPLPTVQASLTALQDIFRGRNTFHNTSASIMFTVKCSQWRKGKTGMKSSWKKVLTPVPVHPHSPTSSSNMLLLSWCNQKLHWTNQGGC